MKNYCQIFWINSNCSLAIAKIVLTYWIFRNLIKNWLEISMNYVLFKLILQISYKSLLDLITVV